MRSNGGERITGATQDILESEGLTDAVNIVGEVLRGTGAGKYAARHWMGLTASEHREKCCGHMAQRGDDRESGLPHEAHAAARALMALAIVLRGRHG
jgi:hypothetical protein